MQNTGNQYRLQKISEIQQQLEAEKEKRVQLGEKYKKGVKAVDVIDYVLASTIVGLSILGIGLLTTIIAAPAVITTETITMAAGMLFILSRQVKRKLKHKATKHEKINVLSQDVLQKISGLISKALNDDKISDEEFSLILSELDTFRETKAKLRTTPTPKDESLLQKIALKKTQNSVKNCV